MSISIFPDALSLFLPISMSPRPTPPTTTMPCSSRSEKLLRDALLKDEKERQHLTSPTRPTHRRRHSHIPTASPSAAIKEDYTRGSFLFRTAMSNPRSPSPASSSFSQDKETEYSPVRRILFYASDMEGIDGPQHRQSQEQRQQNTTSYRCSSPSPSPSRRSGTSLSPSPSPLHMRGRQQPLSPISPHTHTTASTNIPLRPNFRRNQTFHHTTPTSNSHGFAYPSPSYGQGEPLRVTPQEQALRAKLERALIVSGGSDAGSKGAGIGNDKQNGKPRRRGRYSISTATAGSESNIFSAPGGVSKEELRLLTPPPTPPFLARVPSDRAYVPSPYKTATANPSPNGTPTRISVRTQTQRKKEEGLETRRPTQRPVAATGGYHEKTKEPLRPLDSSLTSPRQRQRDVTITQQSYQTLQSSITSPNPLVDPKKSNNNADSHSLASTESCSTETSESSISHLHAGCTSGYSACSSHSSLDGPVDAQHHLSVGHHHHSHLPVQQQSHSSPPSPSPITRPFNARKASTQCRAIQGYVSFASVEGLGEPPLVRDEFDGDGFGDDGRRRKGSGWIGGGPFSPLDMWHAALGWRRPSGSSGPGMGEGQEQGVVV